MSRPHSDRRTAEPLTRPLERRLIQALRQGDQDAARELIDHHKQRLLAFIWRMVPNYQDAEDICQDAFLKAFAAIDSFDPTYRFSTWLFTIAYRLCLNQMRRNEPLTGDLDLSYFPDLGESGGHHQAAASEEALRLKELVWSAVDQLSKPQRGAVILFYRENLSCQDIAEVMGLPIATVKSHLFRARARLKQLLEPAFAGDFEKLRIFADVAG